MHRYIEVGQEIKELNNMRVETREDRIAVDFARFILESAPTADVVTVKDILSIFPEGSFMRNLLAKKIEEIKFRTKI